MTMSHSLIAIIVFVVALASSLLFVSRAIIVATKLGLLDQPAPRRVHQIPVPRSGGTAVFLAFTIGILITFILDVPRNNPEIERLLLVIGASALVVGVMLYDDILGMAPLPKLLWQIGAAAIVVLPRFQGIDHGIVINTFNAPFAGEVKLPASFAVLFTLFWIVGMMNTINWVDGLDGLASSVTLVACAVLFAHTYFWPRSAPQFTISLLPLALGAAVIGFLWFNWHPAKVILGDAGANFLGFALAVISIIGGAKIATAMLALGLPILDVAWVIFYRVSHGRAPYEADRGHLHHRLLDGGWTQAQIVIFVSGVSALFGVCSLLLSDRLLKGALIGAIGLVLLGTIGLMAFRDREKRTQAVDDPLEVPHSGN
jgi:UDP-N-acetylmuramyl pentapeptide phosphotransferase/UDP-N-acetylglucosamine-1-phosphate transferase